MDELDRDFDGFRDCHFAHHDDIHEYGRICHSHLHHDAYRCSRKTQRNHSILNGHHHDAYQLLLSMMSVRVLDVAVAVVVSCVLPVARAIDSLPQSDAPRHHWVPLKAEYDQTRPSRSS